MPHIMHLHHQQSHRGHYPSIPRGHVAVTVGPEHRRFVVPVVCVNHPLFTGLLKEVEEEYGSDYYREGPIHIPCHVEEFCRVVALIEGETASFQHHHHDDDRLSLNHNHHHHHHHQFLCFKALM